MKLPRSFFHSAVEARRTWWYVAGRVGSCSSAQEVVDLCAKHNIVLDHKNLGYKQNRDALDSGMSFVGLDPSATPNKRSLHTSSRLHQIL